jgi:hypothetical protein
MKKVAILETYQNGVNYKKSIDAHLRNAIEIADYLNADLLLSPDDYRRALSKNYDVLILANSSHYAPFFYIRKIVEKNPNAEKYVISNEYNKAESVGGFKPFNLISNYEATQTSHRQMKRHYCLNLNLLFVREPNKLDLSKKTYDCIYYGTFRPNRQRYFVRYLQKPIYLSSSSRNFKKYKHAGANPHFVKQLSWTKGKETLNRFKYSLYIEDEYTHRVFNNLANRWYEAGFCNNVVFFDASCSNTVRKSELAPFYDQMKDYFVNNNTELIDKIDQCNADGFEKHLAIQKAWRKDELKLRRQMLVEFKQIIEN